MAQLDNVVIGGLFLGAAFGLHSMIIAIALQPWLSLAAKPYDKTVHYISIVATVFAVHVVHFALSWQMTYTAPSTDHIAILLSFGVLGMMAYHVVDEYGAKRSRDDEKSTTPSH